MRLAVYRTRVRRLWFLRTFTGKILNTVLSIMPRKLPQGKFCRVGGLFPDKKRTLYVYAAGQSGSVPWAGG